MLANAQRDGRRAVAVAGIPALQARRLDHSKRFFFRNICQPDSSVFTISSHRFEIQP